MLNFQVVLIKLDVSVGKMLKTTASLSWKEVCEAVEGEELSGNTACTQAIYRHAQV